MAFLGIAIFARAHFSVLAAITLIAASPTPASAEKFVVLVPSAQIVMPNQTPTGQHTYSTKEPILDLPLLWRDATKLDQDVSLTIDGKQEIIPAKMVLPLYVIGSDTDKNQQLNAFCTPRVMGENKTKQLTFSGVLLGNSLLGRGIMRAATDRQLCLIDMEGDGRFDHWVLLGDGSDASRLPNSMPAIAFSPLKNVPISDQDRYKVRLWFAAQKQAGFELEIVQQGQKQRFTEMVSDGARYRANEKRKQPDAGWPLSTNLYGADLTIIETKKDEISISWPEAANRDDQIRIPEDRQYTTYYYVLQ